jgi:lipoic acid synthetase
VLTKLPCLRCKWQGFRYVASGPMVRSSYKAGEFYIKAMIEADRAKSTTAADSSA